MKTIEIVIPGSKSYTNRALIMAALADGKSRLINHSKSDDSKIIISALKKLGIKIIEKKDCLLIWGHGGKFRPVSTTIDVSHAGTAMRFLTALCSLVPGEITIDGSARMRERPIKELVEALKKLGAKIDYLGKNGFPPLKIFGGTIKGGKVKIRGDISSQFVSALLLIGPVLEKKLDVKIIGKQISRSYINMTIDGLKKFSRSRDYPIEGDASGASYFWAMAAITGKRVRVKNINPLSVQGDVKFVEILKKMGCLVKKNNKDFWIEVKGPKKLRGVTADMSLMPDTAQTLAVVAAFAEGKTKITGLSTLRIKETDRLQALKTELAEMGINSQITNDSITIEGGSPKSAEIETYNDHRMAMAFAVAGAKIPGIIVKNPEVVSKSFPDFWEKMKLFNNQIILIGFMGSGKTTVANIIAKKLNLKAVEMDRLVLKKSGRNSVSEIFSLDGEEHFRDLETKVIKDISKFNNVVVSTGGGVVMKERNLKLLKNGIIFFLKTSFETLEKRLKNDDTRPLFKDKIKARKLFDMRQKIYEKWADHIILTDNKSIDQIVTSLLNTIKT